MKNYLKTSVLILLIVSGCAGTNVMPSKKIGPIQFNQEKEFDDLQFIYQNNANNPDLERLRRDYALDEVTSKHDTDMAKILALMDWTHRQWSHNGSNQPSESNTFTILEEAKQGKKFRCVEYGIVLRSVLAAYDYPARTLSLKTRDVATTRIGAGHVLTEVWLPDMNKWALLDGQFNAMPVLDGRPLNAVELQEAIILKKDFDFVNLQGSLSEKEKKKYLRFIPHYLYYFDFRMDQREIPLAEKVKIHGSYSLMLVPIGAENPTIFQIKHQLGYILYTNSLANFYQAPN